MSRSILVSVQIKALFTPFVGSEIVEGEAQ